MMRKPEILAPAGGTEQLQAAVRCGADAVYLGTQHFNARNAAANFDEESLQEAVRYCHARNVKVYVTMNTLLTDRETEDVIREIKMIAASGVDAVILQDLAAAALWKQYCPSMRLHASTQMTIHNFAGAKAAEALGFRRIVLARELSLSEIQKIAANTNAEIEVFVHGALCMSVSGTCLLSSMLGARSGNRGRCAQPCRLNFRSAGREYALSLKDLSLVDELDSLAAAGVTSFKIEGRMKRPEYVAAAVTAVRKSLAGEPFDMESLQAVFSRSGFTKGYLTGKRTVDMFGYRRHEDVTAAAPVLKSFASLYKDEIRKIPISLGLTATRNGSTLTASDGVHTVQATGEPAVEAVSKPLTKDYAEKCCSKTGGTIFFVRNFSVQSEENTTLSAAAMNAMRRDALEQLYELRSQCEPKPIVEPAPKNAVISARSGEQTLRLRFERFAQAFDDERVEKIILPLREILKHPETADRFSHKLVCELPFLVFAQDEDAFLRQLAEVKNMGVREVLADNIGVLTKAKEFGFTVHGGHGLNLLNSIAAEEYVRLGAADLTLSPEIAMQDAACLRAPCKKGVLVYGYLPLMRFRVCPARGKDGCGDCTGHPKLLDRLGKTFYILCSEKKYSSLLNSVPLYIGDKPHDGLDFVTLYFTGETADVCRKITDAFCEKRALSVPKTGGLYYRELL